MALLSLGEVLALLFPPLIVGLVVYVIRRDARKKGIHFLAYLGVVVAMIAVGVVGSVFSVWMMDWFPGTPGVVGMLVAMLATAAACIGVAVMGFKRLLVKQPAQERRRAR